MGFKIFWLEKNLIKGSPIIKTIAKDVKRANPVLKVMYLKTFKNPNVSTKFSKNLSHLRPLSLRNHYYLNFFQ